MFVSASILEHLDAVMEEDIMTQWYCHIGGRRYGPIPEDELKKWIAQGRVRPSDPVWTEGMPNWSAASAVPGFFPDQDQTAAGSTYLQLQPHRGGAILALGILGLIVCFICGIIAWVMGNNDLRKMDHVIMDPIGRDMTQAGKICGMISTIIIIVGMVMMLLWIIFWVAVGVNMFKMFYAS